MEKVNNHIKVNKFMDYRQVAESGVPARVRDIVMLLLGMQQ